MQFPIIIEVFNGQKLILIASHADDIDDDDDDVTGLQTTKACLNYEAVWDRTGPLLIQPGSNLGQWPTQP